MRRDDEESDGKNAGGPVSLHCRLQHGGVGVGRRARGTPLPQRASCQAHSRRAAMVLDSSRVFSRMLTPSLTQYAAWLPVTQL